MEKFFELIDKAQELQKELEREFNRIVDTQSERFQYSLKKGKVLFDQAIKSNHKAVKEAVWPYIRGAKLATLLTAPVIYSLIIIFVLLDIWVTIYQHICFRAYKIDRVKRADYILVDRQHLAYLNIIEKINCVYCSYCNGVIAYVREVAARTEQYWCPIKHSQRVAGQHYRHYRFVDYGDAEAWKEKIPELREMLASSKS